MISGAENIIRISITGPESTGKSTLAKELADHYSTAWVPEYARDYIEKLGRQYNENDLYQIALGQKALEKESLLNANKYLFCDTDPLVLKIWSEHRYGATHPFISSEFKKVTYNLYLLMDIDLPWQYDPQREHPEKRQFFFDWFEGELKSKEANYSIVSGDSNDRLKNAIQIIEKQFG